MWWVIHMCRGFDPLFSLWQDRARSFWGIFSHPPTPKRSFGVLKLPILKEFNLLGPKFHFSLNLFGSNFQRPAAHPHQFSDRVPPPGSSELNSEIFSDLVTRLGWHLVIIRSTIWNQQQPKKHGNYEFEIITVPADDLRLLGARTSLVQALWCH